MDEGPVEIDGSGTDPGLVAEEVPEPESCSFTTDGCAYVLTEVEEKTGVTWSCRVLDVKVGCKSVV